MLQNTGTHDYYALHNRLHSDTVNCFNTAIADQRRYPLTSLYHNYITKWEKALSRTYD